MPARDDQPETVGDTRELDELVVPHLLTAVKPGGTVIMATFALDGPERCSGLPVCRYDAESMSAELGAGFALVETVADAHPTPGGSVQSFNYNRFVREP